MTKLSLACGLMLTLGLVACASSPQPAAVAQSSASSAPASAPAAAPASSTAATAQASAKPKLICEEEKPLGSLLPQRICMTPEEAAARQKAAQDKMRNLQNDSAVGPGMGAGGSSGG